jgi:hypothetical protein
MKSPLFAAFPVLLVIGAVYGSDAPFLKDGYWSVHMLNTRTMQGKPAKPLETTMTRCNKASAMPAPPNPSDAKACKTIRKSTNGAVTTLDMQCTFKGQKGMVKQTNTVTSEDEKHSVMEYSFNRPISGMSDMKVVTDWKYLGACPAGIQPNDVVMADGKIMHQPER